MIFNFRKKDKFNFAKKTLDELKKITEILIIYVFIIKWV